MTLVCIYVLTLLFCFIIFWQLPPINSPFPLHPPKIALWPTNENSRHSPMQLALTLLRLLVLQPSA
jgi:predicted ABC-type exoprotein transport system permease subunit